MILVMYCCRHSGYGYDVVVSRHDGRSGGDSDRGSGSGDGDGDGGAIGAAMRYGRQC
jgi:hypothetical protein